MPDLATFGEGLLRLTPPDDTPLELADRLDVHVGGAANNVAVAGARLGLDATWLSKLADTPQAHRVTGHLRRHGVEPAVVWTDEGRQGTYYLETADAPRGPIVTYDREGAAVRSATAAELPTESVESADAFHATGIAPALSSTLRETTADLLALAQDADTTTCFDLNYRSKLWEPADARETVESHLPAVDWFVLAARDAEPVMDRSGPPASVARGLAADFDLETVILTRREEGALAVHDGEVYEQPAFEAGDAHPVGSGDAFVGGYLAERLQGGGVQGALAYGAATAALKRTIPGDVAAVSREAVERVVAGHHRTISR
jgi:2-dehydro-3-deoxygluconokinase